MKKQLLIITACLLGGILISCSVSVEKEKKETKLIISFSFDDGSIQDFPNYPSVDWNQLLLDNLHKNNVKAGARLNRKKYQA